MTHHFATLRSRYPVASRVALLAVAAVVFTLLTSLIDGNAGVAPLSLLSEPRFALANALPGLLMAGLLLVITRRVLLSFGLTFLLQALMYGVNAIKVAHHAAEDKLVARIEAVVASGLMSPGGLMSSGPVASP